MTIPEISALPVEDAEQLHVRDEIEHADLYEAVHHDFAVRCGNCGQTQPITIGFRVLPDESER